MRRFFYDALLVALLLIIGMQLQNGQSQQTTPLHQEQEVQYTSSFHQIEENNAASVAKQTSMFIETCVEGAITIFSFAFDNFIE